MSFRIALLFEYPTLNGGERSMLACLDWWQCQAADVEFVALAPGQGRLAEALSARSVNVLPWEPGEDAEQRLVDAVQAAAPHLLHANSLAMGRLTGRIATRLSIPTSSHLRDILKLSRASIADLNENRLLIAVSQATRDAHLRQGMDPDRIQVVHNGIDLDQFQPLPPTGWLHRELNLPPSARLVATIGQIGLRKGQDVLAAAAPAIVQAVPETHFLLIGERSSGKLESIQFENQIDGRFAEANLGPHLHRLGYRDDVAVLLSELDLVVHPAHQEPFGRVLLEATACGVPVVATHVGGTAEIVVDGVTGRLIPPKDPVALATAVAQLLQDPEQRHRMGMSARDHAVREFDVSRCATQLMTWWRTLLD